MEPEGSLQHSQEPVTCPYPEPDQSSPCPPSHFLKIHFCIIFTFTPGPSKWFLPSGLPTKILNPPLLYPLLATCAANLVISYFITRIIFDEAFRSLSSSLCNLLHYPVNSSILGPNILLSTTDSSTLSLRSFLSYIKEHD
jgi:hypothetical protein